MTLALPAPPRRPLCALAAAFTSLCVLCATPPPAAAQQAAPGAALVPVPPLASRVTDQTNTLDASQRTALNDKLAAFEREAGPQIAVLMVPTTQPEDITDFTQRVGDAWKIGRRDVGDGLLVVVAKNDRRVRIAPAKALEGAVPDLAARQIIDQQMTPAFRQGDYAGGLNRGLDALIARVRGEPLPPPPARGTADAGATDWGGLGMFLFVGVPLVGGLLSALLGRKLAALVTAGATGAAAWAIAGSVLAGAVAAVLALVLVGEMGVGGRPLRGSGLRRGGFVPPVIWGGGSGGGIGGGGFSSGGGGNFGGGGASGQW